MSNKKLKFWLLHPEVHYIKKINAAPFLPHYTPRFTNGCKSCLRRSRNYMSFAERYSVDAVDRIETDIELMTWKLLNRRSVRGSFSRLMVSQLVHNRNN
ncbi:hypothetical protein NPIL_204551 [Nephila pilipes]|uniref:Uncharacterized protein n=1 Tax=Nephila pilipes TaxID=299642 RepID=A0A8X6THR9_NEPPI|nr:hypothetical protein NPIL_204551 [Nephila pilipes]